MLPRSQEQFLPNIHDRKTQERRLVIEVPEGRSPFVFPGSDTAPPSDDPIGRTLNLLSAKVPDSRHMVTIKAGSPGFPKTTYTTFEKDPLFGTITWTCIPESEVRVRFLKGNLPLISFSAVSILGISLLFAGLYRQARRLEKTLLLATTDPATGPPNRRALKIRANSL